jgi:hypothetical protein
MMVNCRRRLKVKTSTRRRNKLVMKSHGNIELFDGQSCVFGKLMSAEVWGPTVHLNADKPRQ